MSARVKSAVAFATDEIVAPPSLSTAACDDHSFQLPTGIYVAMTLCFFGAIAILALAFRQGMGVSYAIIFAFLIAFFGIPAIFVHTSPASEKWHAIRWYDFLDKGMKTHTGRIGGFSAAILVLLLPLLILSWAIAIAVIATVVR